jgi:hypothetical protein
MITIISGGPRFCDTGRGHGEGFGKVHPPQRREGVWGAEAPQIFLGKLRKETQFE